MTRKSPSRAVIAALAPLAIAMAVLAAAPSALAQFEQQQTKLPPTPTSSDKPPALIQYGVLVVLTGGVVALSIMKSKREVRN
ncbi:MAG: hypothetical protein H6813_04085 [Phycisphaeraceae bacterium]|nr:hypothetical protein [Phycisphaeraceae bacterium]MCB9847126.1 hypothetical protein [Phycisphaeraceae bacterium]